MSKVLITGATGFLGSRLAERLAAEGYDVTATGRNRQAGDVLARKGLRFVACDLSQSDSVHELCKNHQLIVHCAALSSPWGRFADFFSANVLATENLIEAARRAGVERLVHISTPSLYVEPRDREQIQESEPLPEKAINDYAETKRQAEALLLKNLKSLPSIILRPQALIGVGDPSILPRIIATAKKGIFPVIDQGRHRLDLTPIESVVGSIVFALRASEAHIGKIYNITNGEPIEIYPAIQKLLKELQISYREKHLSFKKAWRVAGFLEGTHRVLRLSSEPLLTRYSACVLGKTRTLSIQRAIEDLGYRPAISLERCLESTLPWLKMNLR